MTEQHLQLKILGPIFLVLSPGIEAMPKFEEICNHFRDDKFK